MKIYSFPLIAMGGPGQIKIQANSKAKAKTWAISAINEINRLETKYSRYRDDSVISKINAGAFKGVTLDDETVLLINYADQLFTQSDQMFDITSGVLRNAWDFKSTELPSQSSIDKLLPLTGWQQVTWEPPYLKFPFELMQIDFGGYVKEYAADAAAKLCRESGAEVGMVELAGDISIIGSSENSPGWPIGIRNPWKPECAIARTNLLTGGLASSGDYERCFVVDGQKFSHILNPLTGWPVSTMASVSVIADHSLLAGSLSTIAMLKGENEGLHWLESTGAPYCCITQDGKIHLTKDFKIEEAS